jgi:hypothetical protein
LVIGRDRAAYWRGSAGLHPGDPATGFYMGRSCIKIKGALHDQMQKPAGQAASHAPNMKA